MTHFEIGFKISLVCFDMAHKKKARLQLRCHGKLLYVYLIVVLTF